ncbi:MAG: hypothetical protein IJV31_09235 [Clostridia bacterium]|nr:hypothetical protein [Clostridia bacterium]
MFRIIDKLVSNTLKNTINNLQDDLNEEKRKVEERNKMIKYLLQLSDENKSKMQDLENNIEILNYNLNIKNELVKKNCNN